MMQIEERTSLTNHLCALTNPEISEVKKMKRTPEIKDIVAGVAGYYGWAEDDRLKWRKRTERAEDSGVFIKGSKWEEEC